MAEKNVSTAHSLHEVPSIGANQCDAGTKPKRRTAKIKTVPPAPAFTLTSDEARLVTAHRKMDDRGQRTTLCLAELRADKYPRQKAPMLRLIAGGA